MFLFFVIKYFNCEYTFVTIHLIQFFIYKKVTLNIKNVNTEIENCKILKFDNNNKHKNKRTCSKANVVASKGGIRKFFQSKFVYQTVKLL